MELSDKFKGIAISVIGLTGTICGIGLIHDNPGEIINYSGTIASLGCLYCGIGYIKK